MLDMSKITAAIVKQLKADPELIKLNANISRNRYINMNPDNTPWIGVYKNNVKYDPRSLGRHSTSFKAAPDLRIVAQMGGLDEVAVEDNLELLVQRTLNALWADPTFYNQVDMITGFDIQYSFEESNSEAQYFQWAVISVKLEVSTG